MNGDARKPVGSRWYWTASAAGYRQAWDSPCEIVSVTPEHAPHHQSPTRKYDYVVRLLNPPQIKVYATEASLSPERTQ